MSDRFAAVQLEADARRPCRPTKGDSSEMPLLADYPFMDVMWTMLVFFAWLIWISLIVMTLADVFRRTDQSGASKAAWTFLIVFLPLVGVLSYMLVRPPENRARIA
jgi:hypothetical protein